MNRTDSLALNYRCERCLAGKGVWCRTSKGAVATALHTGRTDPLQLAYGDGYLDGASAAERQLVPVRDAFGIGLVKRDPRQVAINKIDPSEFSA